MVGRPVPLLRLVALSCCLAGCSALAQPRSLLRITRLPPSPLLPHSPPLAPQRLPLAGLPLAPLARSVRPLPARSSALVLSTNAEDESSAANVEAALQQTAAAVAAAFAFAGGIFFFRGGADAEAWIAAYLLEESLSVDNLFVFSVIFDFFKTPPGAPQARVLKWGLIVAVVLRASFIVGGLAVVERFEAALVPCGLLLLYSAYGILSEEEEEDAADNPVIKTVKQASLTQVSHTLLTHTSLTPFSIFPCVALHFSHVSRAPPPPPVPDSSICPRRTSMTETTSGRRPTMAHASRRPSCSRWYVSRSQTCSSRSIRSLQFLVSPPIPSSPSPRTPLPFSG